jgi:prepilin-type N-terminal cleavage/methylation domain-containing protein/prepilin-type processing-associated H-X9-DG protein
MNRHRPFVRGFTLVELLVVIGIIAVLISLLLPSLQSARASAKTIVCQSTLRQFGIANAMYLSEQKSYYVPIFTADPATPASKDWWYQNKLYRNMIGLSIPDNSGGRHYTPNFICPDAEAAFTDDVDGNPAIDRTYGMNETNLVNLLNLTGGFNTWTFYGLRNNQVRNGAEVIMMADGLDEIIARGQSADYTGEGTTGIFKQTAYRHGSQTDPLNAGRGTNVLFFDLHVAPRKRSEVDRDLAEREANLKLWRLD